MEEGEREVLRTGGAAGDGAEEKDAIEAAREGAILESR